MGVPKENKRLRATTEQSKTQLYPPQSSSISLSPKPPTQRKRNHVTTYPTSSPPTNIKFSTIFGIAQKFQTTEAYPTITSW
uniref:Putative ovule protein n=1 Tax=Solanum chacoense TaxID=4108 RepID=A0A0V0GSF3_SOLCH